MATSDHTKIGFGDNFALDLSGIVCNSSNNKDLGPGSRFF